VRTVAGGARRRPLYEVTHLPGEHERSGCAAAGLAPLTADQLDGPIRDWRGPRSPEPAGCCSCAAPARSPRTACCTPASRRCSASGRAACCWPRPLPLVPRRGVRRAAAASGPDVSAALRALAPDVAAFDHAHLPRRARTRCTHPRASSPAVVQLHAGVGAGALVLPHGTRWGDGSNPCWASAPVDVVTRGRARRERPRAVWRVAPRARAARRRREAGSRVAPPAGASAPAPAGRRPKRPGRRRCRRPRPPPAPSTVRAIPWPPWRPS